MSLGGAYCEHAALEARDGARGAQDGRAVDVRARRRDALEAHLALLLVGRDVHFPAKKIVATARKSLGAPEGRRPFLKKRRGPTCSMPRRGGTRV